MKKELGLLLLFTVFTFALISCGGEKKTDTTKDVAKEEVKAEEVADAGIDLAAGEETYNKFCHVCHKDGIAGAPKLGDKALWGPRAEKGMATLIKHVTEGYTGETGVMPLKGTCMDCSEEDFRNSITFMLKQAELAAK